LSGCSYSLVSWNYICCVFQSSKVILLKNSIYMYDLQGEYSDVRIV
jgi:hypothetical protein